MVCKKLDFVDIELEETVKGYLISDENEIIVFLRVITKKDVKNSVVWKQWHRN